MRAKKTQTISMEGKLPTGSPCASRATAIRAMDGVISADAITGPTDVIVRLETSSIDELGQMVVSKIHAVDGITRTQTCPVVNL